MTQKNKNKFSIIIIITIFLFFIFYSIYAFFLICGIYDYILEYQIHELKESRCKNHNTGFWEDCADDYEIPLADSNQDKKWYEGSQDFNNLPECNNKLEDDINLLFDYLGVVKYPEPAQPEKSYLTNDKDIIKYLSECKIKLEIMDFSLDKEIITTDKNTEECQKLKEKIDNK